jgi:hypothetical protein
MLIDGKNGHALSRRSKQRQTATERLIPTSESFCCNQVAEHVWPTSSTLLRGGAARENHDMLWIVASVVIAVVILFALFRARRSTGLDALGAVSPRWIADERTSSHDDRR